jgi:hypothetical protein
MSNWILPNQEEVKLNNGYEYKYYNHPINLNLCRFISKYDNDNLYFIQFYFSENYSMSWYFKNNAERNLAYSNIFKKRGEVC